MTASHDAARRSGEGALRRFWPIGLAALLLAALWGGPLPELSRVSFSAHMALHLGVVALAGPALAVGLARLVSARRPPGGWLVWAGLASLVELVVVWGWHAPALHAAAAYQPAVFVLQQGSFLAAGVIVWLPGLVASGGAGLGAGIVAMGLSFTHMSMLGVLLTLAPRLIYPDGLCGGAFGLDALTDQRLGGVMMAVFGGVVYLAGAIIFGYRLLSAPAPSPDSR